MSAVDSWEAVIGLEIHCQLATESKIFCACPARSPDGVSVADVPANQNTCPVCAGLPGSLPVLNRLVVEYAVRAGLAMDCRINSRNVFARKNYFYPDSPKGYQISQYELPVCENGFIDVQVSKDIFRRVSITRIHMEEDAGKSTHQAGFSLVNLNRCGVPLIEIVSGPDLRSSQEAGAYMRAVHEIVTHIGISDGNMQEGNFRCDANVSVRPRGEEAFGTRVEIKNVNSFRFVEKAIDFEIARQISVKQAGGDLLQETRLFDSDRGVTISMRSKEEAMDYRYFPDPDLITVHVEDAWIARVKAALPERPAQKRARYSQEWGLSSGDTIALTSTSGVSRFFEEVAALLKEANVDPRAGAKQAANWISGELARLASEEGLDLSKAKATPRHVADLVRLSLAKVISSTGAKEALVIAWRSGESIEAIVEREGLKQVSDAAALQGVVDLVLSRSPAQVAEFKSGKEKVLGFLVGQVMKEMKGKGNPGLVSELLKRKLS